jgi:predicted DsbA family dithiol-disulfide isomerase
MTIIVRNLILLALFAHMPAFAQEGQHDQHQAQQETPVHKDSAPSKTGSTKCCEGMEKKGEMKAKMDSMKEMKEKMAEKMGEKGMKLQTKESKVEKNPTSKDAHQH